MASIQDLMDEATNDIRDFSKYVMQKANERNSRVQEREPPRVRVESVILRSPQAPSKLIPDNSPIPADSCRKWYSNPVTYT